eukprot:TRINITY_DN8409_c0_g1_i1.p1 TRINITY_DN8409_c0_g1~~TRINITY_DN8409_c0_g1_i1.p1  ORF type:complete len:265 (-),score=35.04 TRINITY_DN8409_c0_g1_i1:322-1116(-)
MAVCRASLLDLNDDCLGCIFAQLPTPSALAAVELVCKRFLGITRPFSWNCMCIRLFPDADASPDESSRTRLRNLWQPRVRYTYGAWLILVEPRQMRVTLYSPVSKLAVQFIECMHSSQRDGVTQPPQRRVASVYIRTSKGTFLIGRTATTKVPRHIWPAIPVSKQPPTALQFRGSTLITPDVYLAQSAIRPCVNLQPECLFLCGGAYASFHIRAAAATYVKIAVMSKEITIYPATDCMTDIVYVPDRYCIITSDDEDSYYEEEE